MNRIIRKRRRLARHQLAKRLEVLKTKLSSLIAFETMNADEGFNRINVQPCLQDIKQEHPPESFKDLKSRFPNGLPRRTIEDRTRIRRALNADPAVFFNRIYEFIASERVAISQDNNESWAINPS